MHDSPVDVRGQLGALLHAAGTLQASAEARLAEVGLSLPKLMALRKIADAGESIALSQLATRLSCVKSNITQLVDRLEADGFVSRGTDPNDRRSRLAVLTPEGRDACQQGGAIYDAAERELLSHLSDSEARQLAGLLEKLGSHSG
jgi:DNA-binding MarR family transcriptional regulator